MEFNGDQALEALRRHLLVRKGKPVSAIAVYLARALVAWEEQRGLPQQNWLSCLAGGNLVDPFAMKVLGEVVYDLMAPLDSGVDGVQA